MFVASAAARALGVLQQPGLLRTEHRMGGANGARADEVFALQGASIGRALVEDGIEHMRRLARAVRPPSARATREMRSHGVVTTAPQPMRASKPPRPERVSLPIVA
jgi:hypothetical protein